MAQAATVKCPDPNTSSLQWGKVPEPWFADPYSLNRPQGEVGTQFVRANILVAGLGRGAVCTYKNSVGFYSIWWPGRIKIPAREDANWIDTYGGFVCTKYAECLFSVADQDSI
ncbi:DUF3757 domain-containing protein [Legionella fairfieldensis]|uniref:DUF3757 domain-containing protein n=1 Tax=Legionella fairfieldensis TaxID=45064 RepID=UPI003BF8B5C6